MANEKAPGAESNENTDFNRFTDEALKGFKNMKLPGFDMEQLMAQYRKNMESCADIQRETMDAGKTLAQINSEYTRQAIEDFSSFMRQAMTSGTNMKDKVDLQATALQQSMEKSMRYAQQVSEVVNKSSEKMAKMSQDKFKDCAQKTEDVMKSV